MLRIKRKKIAVATSTFFMLSVASANLMPVFAGTFLAGQTSLKNRMIGKSIHYNQRQYNLKFGDRNMKEIANVITLDTKDKDVKILTGKAKDTMRSLENLTSQIEREKGKGMRVVGGINASLFSFQTGLNLGPQIKDGKLLLSYEDKSQERFFPIFYVDKDGKPFIERLQFNSKLENTDTGYKMYINTVNRLPRNNEIQLYSKHYATNGVVDFSNIKSKVTYIVLDGVEAPLTLDKLNKGKVKAIVTDKKSYKLNDGEVVIFASGTKADILEKNFKEDSEIEVQVGFNKKNIQEGLSAYNYLVQDGKALTREQMLAQKVPSYMIDPTNKARTAIGITKDDKVVVLTVDGGNASRGVSDGMSQPQLAKLMETHNVVTAINFDGGGSTQMNTRNLGESVVSIANRPSGGAQRSLTNSLLFATVAPFTEKARFIEINAKEDILMYKNSRYRFKIWGEDTNYNPFHFKEGQVKWNSTEGLGKIDAEGLFTSGTAAKEGQVTVDIGGTKRAVNIKVFNKIPVLAFKGNIKDTVLPRESKKQFQLTTKTEDGKNIIVAPENIKWQVEGEIGEIDSKGMFTATDRKSKGKVIAKIGEQSIEVKVTVGKDPVIIDNFEHNDNARYKVNGYVGGVGEISTEQHKSGKYSYKLSYDYDKWTNKKFNGTTNVMPQMKDKDGKDIKAQYTSDVKPSKIGMWVYGDEKAPWLRAALTDATGKQYVVNFVHDVDWKGWKYIEAKIPEEMQGPIQFKYFYFVEIHKDEKNKGTVYIDDLKFIY